MTDLQPDHADSSADEPSRLVREARERLAHQGYTTRFEVSEDRVSCCACRSHLAHRDVRWRVIEVVADADRMVIVGGIRCPVCHERGVAATALDLFGF